MKKTGIGRAVAIVIAMLAYSTMAGAQQPAKKIPVRTGAIAAVQGFNVVLVLGDLEGVPPDSNGNVPTAARKALADMKDFLPYKSYRLLDTAWILSSNESASATSRLRGPDDRDYELVLGATSEPASAPGNRMLRLTFQLRDPGGREASATPSLDHVRATMLEAERRAAAARRDSETKKEGERGTPQLTDEAQRLKAEFSDRIHEFDRALAARTSPTRSGNIIETGFTMDVGETVVVGTSRVRGEKAIIALLTAVPRASKK